MDTSQDISGRGPERTAPRVSLFLLTALFTRDGQPLGKARVRNLSATGMMADCENPIAKDTAIHCDLRGVGDVSGKIVWSRDGKVGIAFDEPIDPQLARKPVTGNGTVMPDYLRPISTDRGRL